MKQAAWLVMCPAARLVPLRTIRESLDDSLRELTVLEGDGMRVRVEDPDDGAVHVLVTAVSGDPIRVEAEDIALGYGASFAKRDLLATFDARYEIVWPAACSIAVFPVVSAIAGLLRARADGVIFDTTGGTLV
jgi:hypothetical protein